MAEKTLKIKFRTDYSPRKKGEVAELEIKLANHYLSIGVAEIPGSESEEKACSDCENLAEANVILENEKELKQTKTTKAKTKK